MRGIRSSLRGVRCDVDAEEFEMRNEGTTPGLSGADESRHKWDGAGCGDSSCCQPTNAACRGVKVGGLLGSLSVGSNLPMTIRSTPMGAPGT